MSSSKSMEGSESSRVRLSTIVPTTPRFSSTTPRATGGMVSLSSSPLPKTISAVSLMKSPSDNFLNTSHSINPSQETITQEEEEEKAYETQPSSEANSQNMEFSPNMLPEMSGFTISSSTKALNLTDSPSRDSPSKSPASLVGFKDSPSKTPLSLGVPKLTDSPFQDSSFSLVNSPSKLIISKSQSSVSLKDEEKEEKEMIVLENNNNNNYQESLETSPNPSLELSQMSHPQQSIQEPMMTSLTPFIHVSVEDELPGVSNGERPIEIRTPRSKIEDELSGISNGENTTLKSKTDDVLLRYGESTIEPA